MKKILLFLLIPILAIFILSLVSAETGLVGFSSIANPTVPQYEIWNTTDFSANQTGVNIGGIIRWMIVKHNPLRNETILGTLDNNSDIKIQFYNGTWSGTYNLTLVAGVTLYRSFDIEIEQLSGDVMVAYNNGTAGIIGYQVWNGTGWYKNGTITVNATSSQVNWIQLASNSNGNEIMLVAQTATPQVAAHYWNGTNWSTSYNLDTSPEIATKKDFNVAFEESGDALITWANSASVYPKYITFSNNVWGTIGNAPASSGQTANFQWMRLANYPGTDRIMLCTVDAGADFNCVEWTGSGWGSVFEITASGEYAGGVSFRNFDIVPEISSGSFFLMFGANGLDYYSTRRCFGISNCQAGIWEAAQTFFSSQDIGTDTSWASLSYDPIVKGQITAVMSDQQNKTNQTIGRISCSNSSNSCASAQLPFSLANSSNVTMEAAMFTYQAMKPTLPNISMNSTVGASLQTKATGNGINDLNSNALYFYCSYSSTQPTSSNTICSEGNSPMNIAYPSAVNCTFTSQASNGNYTLYCRAYDGFYYSPTASANYTIKSSAPTTSLISVAGDTTASYIDTVNDVRTDILVSGEANMLCRWSSSDDAYSSMSKDCSVSGTTANCSINDVLAQGLFTRHISCSDSLGNGQSSSNNLDVQFYLDYATPTTSDNSDSDVHAPNYVVNITEGDAVDGDPVTKYCTSSSPGCNPTTSIDDGGQITYSSSNRGVNYLRYYSTDFAGNIQIAVNKTITINQLPTFTSALDNATTIQGGAIVNVSTNSSDADSSQTISLFVCNSSGANSSGCSIGTYCNTTGTANLSCQLTSESDSASHTWYAYIFDELGEEASNNPLTGSYTTDTSGSIITLNNPSNGSTITQNSVTITITVNEPLKNAWYSLNGNANVSMSNSSLYVYTHSNTTISDGNYNITIWTNDSYENTGNLFGNSFTINTATGDATAPVITIWSPVNNTYYTNGTSLSLNISSDEALSWAGYKNNSGALTNLLNTSTKNWNAAISLGEGSHNITFYANDSSSNENQANKSITIYVDLNNPSIGSFNCTNPVNDSQNVICNASVSDAIGLDYYILRNNATGSWINSSQITLSGTSSNLNYIIGAGNTTPGKFGVELYLYDLSERVNMSSYIVNVTDDKSPEIYNITNLPNTTLELDPDVAVNVNATIVEDYNISSVSLMLMNLTDMVWESFTMSNNSAIINLGNSNIIYNFSFTPKNGTYIFKINATDTAGNQNISANYTIVVENDTSFLNSTTIPDTKSFTLIQAAENNSLGVLYLNNTGDNILNFNINLTSLNLGTRLSINYTLNQTMNYSVSSGENLSLSVEINTTSLAANTYNYNITVSSAAGTTVFSKQLSIQALAAPYLVTSITKYSSSVTRGQTGIESIASVSNFGTEDASDVYLNWTLPSGFTLTSGSLSRNLGNLPIGSSSTNTITVSVASSAADSVVNITANATAAGNLSASDYREVTIGTPTTVVVTVITEVNGAGTVGGGAAAGGKAIVYSKEIEIVRGKENSFDIEVHNPYSNSKLEDLTIKITGFLEKYISVSPAKIPSIGYGETKAFAVKLSVPSYKNYEEHDLQAVIRGKINNGKSISDYSETQWIKVTIQEISKEELQRKLDEAKKAISEMRQKNFYIIQIEKILADADDLLNEKKYGQAGDLSDSIVKIKETAFEADDLLRRVIESMQRPSKNNLIMGNIIRELGSYDTQTPLKSLLTGKTIFASSSTEELVNLGIAAFERGDFTSALERAKQARETLILERKGNFLLFIYLYWYYILLVMFLVSGTGIASYRKYQKTNITRKIEDLNNKENTIRSLSVKEQGRYFRGDISAGEYKRMVNHHQKELAELRKLRGILGNTRIKMLKPQQVSQDLKKENKEVEDEIKKLQWQFYKDKKISEKEYKTQFEAMNERLAEIEDEKTTINLLDGQDAEGITIRKILYSIKEIPREIIRKIKGGDKRGIIMIDNKLVETLKKHTKSENCKKKWVKLNLKNRGQKKNER